MSELYFIPDKIIKEEIVDEVKTFIYIRKSYDDVELQKYYDELNFYNCSLFEEDENNLIFQVDIIGKSLTNN